VKDGKEVLQGRRERKSDAWLLYTPFLLLMPRGQGAEEIMVVVVVVGCESCFRFVGYVHTVREDLNGWMGGRVDDAMD